MGKIVYTTMNQKALKTYDPRIQHGLQLSLETYQDNVLKIIQTMIKQNELIKSYANTSITNCISRNNPSPKGYINKALILGSIKFCSEGIQSGCGGDRIPAKARATTSLPCRTARSVTLALPLKLGGKTCTKCK